MSRKCPADICDLTIEHERTESTVNEEKKAQARAARGEKRRQEERKDRRSMAVYTAVAVLVVAAAAAMMLWNSGILQRSLTALTVNNVKYTTADVQYFYKNVYTNWANQYAFDSNTSVKKQVHDQETGQSWYDFLMEETVQSITNYTALAALAQGDGDYAMSEETRAQLDSTLTQLDSAWIGYNYASRDAFIRANFGPHMTYNRLTQLMEMEYLASDYATSRLDAIDHPDADYEAYYQDHTNELDTIVYTQFAFQAQAPAAANADGSTASMTDEEKAAALEKSKTEQKALAEELKSKLEGGADPEALAEEYADQLYSSSLSRRTTAANASYSTYADWLLDSARKAGDVTLSEQETIDSCYYYVALFQDRLRDEENAHTVRHLLVRAGNGTAGETPTQEQYDQAETKAQELLDEWKAGEATESSFAALASANSADSGSASSGGLISGITSTSSYVQAFKDWALDPARREGDAELVKTEYGWHIMYYSSTDDPIWRQTVTTALRSQDYEQLTAEAAQGWNITRGMGMNLIEA